MSEIPQDLKKLLFGKGARWHAWSAVVLMYLGLVCLIIGIIGDASNRVLGLEPTNWLILAGVLWIMGFSAWVTAYYTAKEG